MSSTKPSVVTFRQLFAVGTHYRVQSEDGKWHDGTITDYRESPFCVTFRVRSTGDRMRINSIDRIMRLMATQTLHDDIVSGAFVISREDPARSTRVVPEARIKRHAERKDQAHQNEMTTRSPMSPNGRTNQAFRAASDMIVGINAASNAESVHMTRSQMLIERLMASDHFSHETLESTALEESSAYRRPLKLFAEAGDGNCLFRAISRQLFGNPQKHTLVRHSSLMYIFINRDTYTPFLEEGVTMPQYVAHMSRSGVWGGEAELSAVSNLFQVKIHVYTLTDTNLLRNNTTSHDGPRLQIRISPYQPLEDPLLRHKRQVLREEAKKRIVAGLALVALFRAAASTRDDFWQKRLALTLHENEPVQNRKLTRQDIEGLRERYDMLCLSRRRSYPIPTTNPAIDAIDRQLIARKLEGESFARTSETESLYQSIANAFRLTGSSSATAKLETAAIGIIENIIDSDPQLAEALRSNVSSQRDRDVSLNMSSDSMPPPLSDEVEMSTRVPSLQHPSYQGNVDSRHHDDSVKSYWQLEDTPESETMQSQMSRFGYFSAEYDPDAMVDYAIPRVDEQKMSRTGQNVVGDLLRSFDTDSTDETTLRRRDNLRNRSTRQGSLFPRVNLSEDSPFVVYRVLKKLMSLSVDELITYVGEALGQRASERSILLQDLSAPSLFELFTSISSSMQLVQNEWLREGSSSESDYKMSDFSSVSNLPNTRDLNNCTIFREIRKLTWLLHVKSFEEITRAISLCPALAIGPSPIRLSYLLQGHYDSLLMADRPVPSSHGRPSPNFDNGIYYQLVRTDRGTESIPIKRNTTVPLPSDIFDLILLREVTSKRIQLSQGQANSDDIKEDLRQITEMERSLMQKSRMDRNQSGVPDDPGVVFIREKIEEGLKSVVEQATLDGIRIATAATTTSTDINLLPASDEWTEDDELALALEASILSDDTLGTAETQSALEHNVVQLSRAEEMKRQMERAAIESIREQELAEQKAMQKALLMSQVGDMDSEIDITESLVEDDVAKALRLSLQENESKKSSSNVKNGNDESLELARALGGMDDEIDPELQRALALSVGMGDGSGEKSPQNKAKPTQENSSWQEHDAFQTEDEEIEAAIRASLGI